MPSVPSNVNSRKPPIAFELQGLASEVRFAIVPAKGKETGSHQKSLSCRFPFSTSEHGINNNITVQVNFALKAAPRKCY